MYLDASVTVYIVIDLYNGGTKTIIKCQKYIHRRKPVGRQVVILIRNNHSISINFEKISVKHQQFFLI